VSAIASALFDPLLKGENWPTVAIDCGWPGGFIESLLFLSLLEELLCFLLPAPTGTFLKVPPEVQYLWHDYVFNKISPKKSNKQEKKILIRGA
jgi:hypothetical protein